ncbi:GTP cyclohydrolase IIa [Acidianus brierleyi]|uniref:GTP cyclohydrolase IIa n=1 Tax=Acidianus brierleyi TaxID=41673 RepID=UPI0013A59013|nr:GTP cyclohydrolase IIa [Acidianus brierleyi]
MKILAVELYKYKDWTESLGLDREWIIQNEQHSLAYKINTLSAELGAFLLPLRYDFFIILVDGIRNSHIKFIFNEIKRLSPVRPRACVGYGRTFIEAQQNAAECIKNTEPENIGIGEYDNEQIVSCHFDIDNFTKLSTDISFYKAFIDINKLYSILSEKIYELGGISQYLGGDNILAFTDKNNVKNILNIVEDMKDIKVGIGIGSNARISIKNSTEALEKIRELRNCKWRIVPKYSI